MGELLRLSVHISRGQKIDLDPGHFPAIGKAVLPGGWL
jgi:hypothetical protein